MPQGAGFADAEKLVGERVAQRVHWNRGASSDEAVDEVVRATLKRELTADDAVQVALLNNRKLQSVYEELGIAQADLVQAGLLKNPFFAGEVRFAGRPVLPLELDVTQDFLDVLLRPLRRRVVEAEFEGTKLRVADAVLDLAADTRRAFYRLQGAEQTLDLRRSVAAAAEASAEAAERLYDAGNITDLDLGNEQALRAQAKLDLAAAESEVAEDREALNSRMGVWGPDTQWTIGSRLPEPPREEGAPEGLESVAVAQRLDLAAARRDLEAAARSVGLSRSSALFPSLEITGHYEREPDGPATAGPGVRIPLPIFDQGQAAVARARAVVRKAEHRYAALAVEIRSQVRAARNRVTAAKERAEYYSRAILPLRRRILEQTQLQYNAMQVGIFQLLQAKQGEIDAVRASIEAIRDYWIARTDLERAVGGRLPGTGSSSSRPQMQKPESPESKPEHPRFHGGSS